MNEYGSILRVIFYDTLTLLRNSRLNKYIVPKSKYRHTVSDFLTVTELKHKTRLILHCKNLFNTKRLFLKQHLQFLLFLENPKQGSVVE